MNKNKTICLLLADITSIAVDVMTNSANESMLAGSGLCGVIHKKGGSELTAACQELFSQQRTRLVGSALATVAGNLPARNVIHAVGPKWYGPENDKEQLLCETYRNILRTADQLEAHTISVPSISTGIHKYPKDLAARIALKSLLENLPNCEHVETVLVISASMSNAREYRQAAAQVEFMGVKLIDFLPGGLNMYSSASATVGG